MVKQFTSDQRQAIDYKGSDILVSAAAGSGKTAVLVERIIQNIIAGTYELDEIFVSTFTNASAKDMKTKLEAALRSHVNRDISEKEKHHLEKQLLKVNDAHISTLHSFCQFLIQNHYNTIGVSPDMRTLSNEETITLKNDVLDAILENWYSTDNEDFKTLELYLATDKGNEGLKQAILNLYNNAVATSSPKEFLVDLKGQWLDTNYLKEIHNQYKKTVLTQVDKAIDALTELETLYSEAHNGVLSQFKTQFNKIEIVIEELKTFKQKLNQDVPYTIDSKAKLPTRNTSLYKKIEDESSKSAVSDQQDTANELFKTVKSTYLLTFQEFQQEMANMNGVRNVLLELASSLIDEYNYRKRNNNTMDFNDFEHFAIEILSKNGGEVADIYKSIFKEVMIDEYQDTNRVQEKIISLIKSGEEKEGNLFMVGDVKQSIYRFRQAEPRLFLEKMDRFQSDDCGKLITLNKNFRSNVGVLETTNYVFKHLMDRAVGEIDYNEEEQLYVGTEDNESLIKTEAAGVIYDKSKNIAVEAELDYVIRKIHELRQQNVDYRDIVILTPSRYSINDFHAKFKDNNIPLIYENNVGYFETLEIRTIINFLSIIDNPLQDDHLVGLCRMPFFNFTNTELSNIRLNSDAHYLYDAFLEYTDEDSLTEKIEYFLEEIDWLRKESKFKSVTDLLKLIFERYNIMEFFSGLPSGDTRCANLNGLINHSIDFMTRNYHSLYEFINYINYLSSQDVDFGEEQVVSEEDDVVRVMTIHASKGLEFKHVFLVRNSRTLKGRDTSKRTLVHPKLGLTMKTYDKENDAILPNLHYEYIQNRLIKEDISERFRVLYVAFTRAEEKLYIPFVQGLDSEAFLDAKNNQLDFNEVFNHHQLIDDKFSENEPLSEAARLQVSRFDQLLVPILFTYDNDYFMSSTYYLEHSEQKEQTSRISVDDLLSLKVNASPEIVERINYQYEKTKAYEESVKDSVSEIKRRNESLPDEANMRNDLFETKTKLRKPSFLETTSEAPIFGTMMHEVMVQIIHRMDQLLQVEDKVSLVTAIVNNYTESFEDLTETNRRRMIDYALRFLDDEMIIKLFKNSKENYTEIPFIMGQKTIEISDIEGKMVQGIIDCLIEYDDKYIILDYKTDQINMESESDLIARYNIQMDIYKRSIEAALQKPVDVYLYYFNYGVLKVHGS